MHRNLEICITIQNLTTKSGDRSIQAQHYVSFGNILYLDIGEMASLFVLPHTENTELVVMMIHCVLNGNMARAQSGSNSTLL